MIKSQIEIIEIEGDKITIPLEKRPKQSQTPEDVIFDLQNIVRAKNQQIEALIEQRETLLDENQRLRGAVATLIK